MSCSVLHHVEVCVKDDRIINQLTRGFGFIPFAYRCTSSSSKLALRSGNSVFVIVKRKSSIHQQQTNTSLVEDRSETSSEGQPEGTKRDISLRTDTSEDDNQHWTVFCCEDILHHTIDSVFNVALVVKDVNAVTKRVQSRGGQVLTKPTNISSSEGLVRYSIVTSCCGNIVHTLIDKSEYSGNFLPGFETIGHHEGNFGMLSDLIHDFTCTNKSPSSNYIKPSELWGYVPRPSNGILNGEAQDNKCISPPITTHIDHVTYVCKVGESKALLAWYEYCFGMKRFMTNRNESQTEGFVLGDNIGLRLKVMEYWKCAESGLASPDNDFDQSLKLVIVEPLPEVSTSHVDSFLRAHGGPGVQHIGLHTPSMVDTVDIMAKNGVNFRKAPPVYYEEGIKLEEIVEAGHANELKLFQELGILLDTEADVFTESEKDKDHNSYLMQVFTKPLFDEDTFFLEVIQRKGARGFGAGNIAALAKSIVLQKQGV